MYMLHSYLCSQKKPICLFVFNLFIHERHRERGRDIGRGRSRLPEGSLTWDLIPRPRDHALCQRQMLYHLLLSDNQRQQILSGFEEINFFTSIFLKI